MSSSVNTVFRPVPRPMPDQKAFDKQPLPPGKRAEIIKIYNDWVCTYYWTIRTELCNSLDNLKNRLFSAVGELSLDNHDLHGLPKLVREIICEIFEAQFEANRKKRVLLDQKAIYRVVKNLNADAALANAAQDNESLPASARRLSMFPINRKNLRIFVVKK